MVFYPTAVQVSTDLRASILSGVWLGATFEKIVLSASIYSVGVVQAKNTKKRVGEMEMRCMSKHESVTQNNSSHPPADHHFFAE